MHKNRFLTLLSDFGLRDVYVGVMKGVIAQINSSLTIVDLTHQIPPQHIAAARFSLMTAYPHFPAGTVHVAIVDPGVGTQRRAIAVEIANGFLVGPDNGLFSGVLNQTKAIAAVELTNSKYWLTPKPSATFQGRDIFAPAGAHLASGVALAELGQAIDPTILLQFPVPECTQTDANITGCIQYIDHFGNLVTNIPGTYVADRTWSVKTGKLHIPGQQTYSDVQPGSPLALIGSHGWVEIAVDSGDAQFQLRMDWGDPVEILLDTETKS